MTPIKKDKSLQNFVKTKLLKCGYNPNLRGFYYLADCIIFGICNGICWTKFCKLYCLIGKRYSSSGVAVERCIRQLNTHFFNNGYFQKLNEILGTKFKNKFDRPCNAEIISLLADKIQQEYLKIADLK